MKAIVINNPVGPAGLMLKELADPVPGPDDIVVDVKATALNRADLAQTNGNYPAPVGSPSNIPGLEMAGVVLDKGQHVTGLETGDRVFGLLGGGGYASRVVLNHRLAVPIPDGLDYVQAAGCPEVFFTAYDALFNHCQLKMGERVLIHAAGSGVGTAAIQLSKLCGAFTFGTAGSQEKLSKAAPLGLDIGINYHVDDFEKIVTQETNGEGINVILDMVGGPYWDRNLRSLSMEGRMVIVGALGGGKIETDIRRLMPKRLTIHGTVLRSRPLEEKISLTQQFRKYVVPWLGQGTLVPVIDKIFPLEEASQALQYMESNTNFGKIILTID